MGMEKNTNTKAKTDNPAKRKQWAHYYNWRLQSLLSEISRYKQEKIQNSKMLSTVEYDWWYALISLSIQYICSPSSHGTFTKTNHALTKHSLKNLMRKSLNVWRLTAKQPKTKRRNPKENFKIF